MLKQYKLKNYHFQLIAYVTLLTILGIMIIGSAEESVQNKQIAGFVGGLIIMVVVSLMDYTVLLKFSWIYYIGICGLLILVYAFGDSSHNAQRWFSIAGIKFQPSEVSKIGIILFFAAFFAKYHEKVNTLKMLMISFILAGIPLVLILKQPDLSTTIVTALIFITLCLLPD